MTPTPKGKCAVCTKHKNELRARKSKLSPELVMYLCNTCYEGKFEPRWLIILVGRRDGIETVQNYLIPKRYSGPEIPASDLVP